MNLDLFAARAVPRERTAGVDEAGRGPLVGAVVVAAVVLHPTRRPKGLADSKTLTEARRETLALRIRERALAYAVCVVEADEIDRLNILQATLAGMSRAVAALQPRPELALVDGNRLPRDLPCEGRAIIGGDASDPAISAASILAKTTRDRLMRELDAIHPEYGFARHKGYPTVEHLLALERHGPLPMHRRSFAPVREWFARNAATA